MKLFISWSGSVSHDLALAFHAWIGMVLQQVTPFISSADIDKGARWAQEIDTRLQDSNFGVLMLTSTNRDAPWLLYEAGALSKQVSSSRVSCLLFDLKHADVEFPLARFQNTEIHQEDVYKLVGSINKACEAPLDEKRLQQIFNKFWPDLMAEFARIRSKQPTETAQNRIRPTDSKIDEILELVRALRASPAGLRWGPRVAMFAETPEVARARDQVYDALFRGKGENIDWADERMVSLGEIMNKTDIPSHFGVNADPDNAPDPAKQKK